MKSIVCILFSSILFFNTLNNAFVFAETEPSVFTDDQRNGYSFFDEKAITVYNQNGYISGLIDGLKYADLIKEAPPAMLAYMELKLYYEINPDQMARPIPQVLLEKYKKSK